MPKNVKRVYLLIDLLHTEIAKSLNIHPDPPTPSPRTALFLKRKFEQDSDSETEEEEGEDRLPEPPAVGKAENIQREWVYVDEKASSRGSLSDGSVDAYPQMSGALQDREGDDDLHL